MRTPGTGPALTADGERSAVQIVRTHRMWERYLADRTGVPAGEWHAEAERMEHSLSAAQVDALDARLGHPVWDPHGDPIPTPAGEMPPEPGFGLPGAEPGRTVEVLHLEDEPREIYDALLDSGLSLGARLEVVERTDRTIRLRAHGRTWDLDPVTADNVTVRYLAEDETVDTSPATLLDAPPGRTVRVASISRACQGAQRRRLLDLGLVPGTAVTPELTSAAGDPVRLPHPGRVDRAAAHPGGTDLDRSAGRAGAAGDMMAKTAAGAEQSRADGRRASAAGGGVMADGLIRGTLIPLRRAHAALIRIEPDAAEPQEAV